MHGQETGMVWRTVTLWNDGNVFKLVGVRNKQALAGRNGDDSTLYWVCLTGLRRRNADLF